MAALSNGADGPRPTCDSVAAARQSPFFDSLTTIGLLLALAAWMTCLILLAAVPPVSRDALTHHLLVPRLYLEHGGMYEIPHIPFAYYPMNVDLLYLIPLAMGSDIGAKYVHMGFGLMTAFLIFAHLKRRLNARWGMLGAFLFLTLPVVVKLSITAYVDLGLVFFSTAGVLSLMRWFESGHRGRHLLSAGVCCGLAMGTKPNGMVVFVLLALAAAFVCDRRWSFFKAAGRVVAFILVALIVFSPWMARNLHWNVSPIYPIALPSWPVPQDRDAPPAEKPQVHLNHFAYRNLAFGESGWRIASIPVRVFFEGRDDDPRYFDGRLNPYLLIFPLVAVWPVRRKDPVVRREVQLLAAFSLCYLLISFFSTDMRIRYLAPIFGPLAILTAYGAARLVKGESEGKTGRPWRIITAGGLLALLMVPNIAYLAGQFERVRPMEYLTGRLDRDAYLARYLEEYPVLQYANANLIPEARILALYLGNRLYYSRRHTVDSIGIFEKAVQTAADGFDVCHNLRQSGFTHLLVRQDLLANWVENNCDAACRLRLDDFASRFLVSLYRHGVFELFAIADCAGSPEWGSRGTEH